MGRAIAAIAGFARPRPFGGLAHWLAEFWRDMTRDARRPYRPERHYMRGPGPACQAKYGNKLPG